MTEVEGKAGFHKAHASESGYKIEGKLDPCGRDPAVQPPKQSSPSCPVCGSTRVVKDGFRYTGRGPIQRLLCRSCDVRFSESTLQPKVKVNVAGKPLKVPHSPMDLTDRRVPNTDFSLEETPNHFSLSSRKDVTSHGSSKNTTVEKGLYPFPLSTTGCRVSATEGEAKNLATVESRKEKAAGATKLDEKTTKGLIIRFMAYLEKEGYTDGYLKTIRRLVNKGANLLDPENVKAVIGEQSWKDSGKRLTVYAYNFFTKMMNIEWQLPRYKAKKVIPFIPEERELDQLVAACRSRRLATFLQTLKETYTDPGEALGIEWTDIDFNRRIITINHPVRGHNPRQIKVSSKVLTMLNTLPKTSERVFPIRYKDMRRSYTRLRKRVARITQNPRFLKIAFTTFRHWGATMIAYYTHGNVLKVKELLGHVCIENTMRYIHLINFKEDDEFDVATATTVKEIKELAAAGFEKIDEMNGIHVFRRPKRFGHG